jgi:predicted nucleic acid-binding protein
MPAEQYVDANVLLAYVLEEEGAPVVEQLLLEADKGDRRLLTSTVSIVEVAFGAETAKGGALDPGTLSTIDNLWSGGRPVALADASIRTMYEARDIAREARRRNRRLTPRDAIHLATAVAAGVEKFFTYEKDETRKIWAEITGLDVEEPNVEQMPML